MFCTSDNLTIPVNAFNLNWKKKKNLNYVNMNGLINDDHMYLCPNSDGTGIDTSKTF